MPPKHQLKARNQIESLAKKYPEIRIYVSSRPSLEIQASSYFQVAELQQLNPLSAIKCLKRLCQKRDNSEKIVSEYKESHIASLELLTTPLMVTLLLLHYRLTNGFPEDMQSFYGDLFEALNKRHDQTKGLTRERKSTANENDLRNLFEYLSFMTYMDSNIEDDKSVFLDYATDGSSYHGRDYDSGAALQDVIDGTNLLLEDGIKCRFPHKTIQEFYAARFLTRQTEEDVHEFFQPKVIEWANLRQFMVFFEALHPYFFYKHFLIPNTSQVIFENQETRVPEGWQPTHTALLRAFGNDTFHFKNSSLIMLSHRKMQHLYFLGMQNPFDRRVVHAISEFNSKVGFNEMPKDNAAIKELQKHNKELNRNESENVSSVSLSHILKHDKTKTVENELVALLTESIKPIYKCYKMVDYRHKQRSLFRKRAKKK